MIKKSFVSASAISSFFFAIVLATFSSPANATPSCIPWTGQITLYGWLAGVGGQLQPFRGGPQVSFHKSPFDTLRDANGAFFASGLARKGSLVFLGDFSYSSSAREGLTPLGIPARGSVTQRSLTILAGKRLVNDTGVVTLDALGGVRLWDINLSASIPGTQLGTSPQRVFGDFIGALRANFTLAPRWTIITYGDIGGGSGAHFTYQVLGTVNFRATRNLYFSAGYRRLYVDIDSGGTMFRGALQGPLAGVTWHFS